MAKDSFTNEPFERDKDIERSLKAMPKDRRTIRMVRDFMTRSSAYRDPHLALARSCRAIYQSWTASGRSIVQRANLRLPYAYTVIQTQLPQLTDIFLRDNEIITLKGRSSEDFLWEDLMTDFFSWQFDEMNFQSKFIAFCEGMMIDGTAVAKVPYKFKEVNTVRRQKITDPVTGETFTDKEEVLEVVYDGPDFENIPVYDFFPDWQVKNPGDIQAMRGCVHRTFKTLIDLKKAGIYKNLDEIKLSLATKGGDAWAPPFWVDQYKRDFEAIQPQADNAKDGAKLEIWEYWGMYDPKGDGDYEPYIITVANGDVVIRADKNFYDYKFKPFVAGVNVAQDGEFYGLSELAPVRTLIKEANAIRNARLDNINISVNPMWVVDRAGGINAKSLYARPNGIIWTNDMNAIKPLPPHDPSLGSKDELFQIQQDINNTTATVNATPTMTQLGKTFGRSATGVEFISSVAGNRIGMKARLLSQIFFKRLAWIMLMTDRQFVTEDQWIRVSNPNSPNPFEQLPPDAFFKRYDFVITTDLESGGPEAQFQRMQAVSQILQVAEQSQPGTVKFDVVLEQMLRPILGNGMKRFVRDEQERQALVNQQMAGQQMVNAALGQGAPQPNAANALDLASLVKG